MNLPEIRPDGWPASPIRHSEVLGRPIRQDGLATLGTSTQTWLEVAVEEGATMVRVGTALFGERDTARVRAAGDLVE